MEKTNTVIEYRPIKGFEGQYEVSNTGLVKSLKGKAERILKPRRKKIIKKDGSVELSYEELVLCNKGVRTSKLVHRLWQKHLLRILKTNLRLII